MNVQHSSRRDDWRTPPDIVARVHEVLGIVDLDPASDGAANDTVRALRYFTRRDDALAVERWADEPANVFLNPPGGKRGNRSVTGLFWDRLMAERADRRIRHAIFIAFSLEALQHTQRSRLSIGRFPFCVPSRRIRFVYPGPAVKNAPSHSNVIVYVPGVVDERDRFFLAFQDLGVVCNRGVHVEL